MQLGAGLHVHGVAGHGLRLGARSQARMRCRHCAHHHRVLVRRVPVGARTAPIAWTRLQLVEVLKVIVVLLQLLLHPLKRLVDELLLRRVLRLQLHDLFLECSYLLAQHSRLRL
jgi:hypothetical protein